MTRTFDTRPAVRERTPVIVGLVAPSGAGKTFSALRLASGFQRVTGGDIHVIDSEARRALHYADRFKFHHTPFGAPFSPADYLAAIDHCVKQGATTIVIDSMSHEHAGTGGVLEMHTAEHKRLGGSEKVKLLAWGKPKQERQKLINAILQMSCNLIMCFRAKEKLKIERGKDPEPMGYMPIAGEEYIFECTLKCLLLPGANGVPTWQSEQLGEKAMIKLPEQFRPLFASRPQLTEDIGEALARWGAGDAPAQRERPATAAELVARYEACRDPATFRALEAERAAAWKQLAADDKTRVKTASKAAESALAKTAADADEVARAEPPTDIPNTDTVTPESSTTAPEPAKPDLDADIPTR